MDLIFNRSFGNDTYSRGINVAYRNGLMLIVTYEFHTMMVILIFVLIE